MTGPSTTFERLQAVEQTIAALTPELEEGEALLEQLRAKRAGQPTAHHWARRHRWSRWLILVTVALLAVQLVREVRGLSPDLEQTRAALAEIPNEIADARGPEYQDAKRQVAVLRDLLERRRLYRRLLRREAPPEATPAWERLRKQLQLSPADAKEHAGVMQWTALGLAACEVKERAPALDAVRQLSSAIPTDVHSIRRDAKSLSPAESGRAWVLMYCTANGVKLLSALLGRPD